MTRAYASAVLDAPVETVWGLIRDFNALPAWHPVIARSEIEDGRAADAVGCVRRFWLQDGSMVRERLLSLDDRQTSFSYEFVTPAFPVQNYLARVRLAPVSSTGQTFAEWEATFDATPEEADKYADIIANGVFRTGWEGLQRLLAERRGTDDPTP
ncbi:SRPBCC family protein [Rhodovastum atsumiense]|uniref:SRPBCC family protein n=1 Tax=Rhodovastum atsumiense TaxID=504468 RepID=A0A5M6J1I8_9PROT|nr:SRPBCC family protein [Rhodovastum atsumiense]KAA5614079.1 SRPBCC family protein [Rhodovastum atsumiense]CAH2598899.1 SRPBCC family protein [Rhodovastum atsumiense]